MSIILRYTEDDRFIDQLTALDRHDVNSAHGSKNNASREPVKLSAEKYAELVDAVEWDAWTEEAEGFYGV